MDKSKLNFIDSLMIISKSVNRHLAQSDYINISKNFCVLDISVYLTLSSTVTTILGNIELLLISFICDFV